jgi:hypothetical protein
MMFFLFESAGNFDDRKTLHNVTVQQLQNRTKCVEGHFSKQKSYFVCRKKKLFTLRDNRNL